MLEDIRQCPHGLNKNKKQTTKKDFSIWYAKSSQTIMSKNRLKTFQTCGVLHLLEDNALA